LADVQGQRAAKRALIIAAAGAHNLLILCLNTPIFCRAPANAKGLQLYPLQ
jgi:hypothetical protein